MVNVPVYRCRCGEVLYDEDDARYHLTANGPGEHAYRSVVTCDYCDQTMSEWAMVHHGGVYCGRRCAIEADQNDETPQARGDLPA